MRRLLARLGPAGGMTAVSLLAISGLAQAQTFTVTNTSDSGASDDGSLRGEVLAATDHPGEDTIDFASGLSGTITFAGAGIMITDPIDIEGPGPGQITVAQTSAHRVFDIEMPVEFEPVTIAGLHITGGTAPSGGGNPGIGGDIFNYHSNLTLANDLITGGNAETIGGVASFDGPLTLRSSTVSGNHAEEDAGLSVGGTSNADWSIQSSTISGNVASTFGGGLYAQTDGSGLVEGSTIAGNTAKGAAGINLNATGNGRIVVRNSTIASNTASEDGGGVEITAGPTAMVTIEGSTIAANHANGGSGGGIHSLTTSLSVNDTIVAGNTATAGGPDVAGKVGTAFSLIGNPSGATSTETVAGSDLLGVDPQLGPLEDNGGPTQTMAVSAASPVINKGSSALTTDQRGDLRPVLYPGIASSTAPGANGADIGAFELQAPALTPAPSRAPPSNRFSFGKVKLNEKKGTATVAIEVPGAGIVSLAGSKTVKKSSRTAKGAGTVKLVVKAKGKALRALEANGKVKLEAKFSFAPTGGSPASKQKTLRLVERRPAQ